jgi:hypothetical protein
VLPVFVSSSVAAGLSSERETEDRDISLILLRFSFFFFGFRKWEAKRHPLAPDSGVDDGPCFLEWDPDFRNGVN